MAEGSLVFQEALTFRCSPGVWGLFIIRHKRQLGNRPSVTTSGGSHTSQIRNFCPGIQNKVGRGNISKKPFPTTPERLRPRSGISTPPGRAFSIGAFVRARPRYRAESVASLLIRRSCNDRSVSSWRCDTGLSAAAGQPGWSPQLVNTDFSSSRWHGRTGTGWVQ